MGVGGGGEGEGEGGGGGGEGWGEGSVRGVRLVVGGVRREEGMDGDVDVEGQGGRTLDRWSFLNFTILYGLFSSWALVVDANHGS